VSISMMWFFLLNLFLTFWGFFLGFFCGGGGLVVCFGRVPNLSEAG
jgi:hypothetical protein